jgi:hypothetical protein
MEAMSSVRVMRTEVGTESIPNAPGWSRIVFIAAVCALGGIGFLGATILMNGRVLSAYQRSNATALADVQAPVAPAPVAEAAPKTTPKPKAPTNDRFLAVEVSPRSDINRAALARCRSHVEAGKPFEGLSLKQMAAYRDARRDADPEAICLEYLSAESRAR